MTNVLMKKLQNMVFNLHVKHYYEQPKFIEYWTNKVNETLAQIPEEEHKRHGISCFGT